MTPDTRGSQSRKAPTIGIGGDRIRAGAPNGLGPAAGFARDARIVTARGMRLVQDLRPGDLVMTRRNGVTAIDRIEQQSLLARAVYVIAGSIGHRQPDRDTLLPAGQCVLVRDWRARAMAGRPEYLAPAHSLVDGEYIRDVGFMPMTLYRVYCAAPQVLYADGMELGTADCIPAAGKPRPGV